MPTNTTNQQLPVPLSGDDPDVVGDMTALALAIEKKLVQKFTNVTDRSTRVPSPVQGMFAYMVDTASFMVYNGTAWVNAIGNGLPTFTSGSTVPANTSGANGDVFFKI